MRLTVNGKEHEIAAATLAALLSELEYEGGWLATALNGEVVPASERAARRLQAGDRVEILSPRQGG